MTHMPLFHASLYQPRTEQLRLIVALGDDLEGVYLELVDEVATAAGDAE